MWIQQADSCRNVAIWMSYFSVSRSDEGCVVSSWEIVLGNVLESCFFAVLINLGWIVVFECLCVYRTTWKKPWSVFSLQETALKCSVVWEFALQFCANTSEQMMEGNRWWDHLCKWSSLPPLPAIMCWVNSKHIKPWWWAWLNIECVIVCAEVLNLPYLLWTERHSGVSVL